MKKMWFLCLSGMSALILSLELSFSGVALRQPILKGLSPEVIRKHGLYHKAFQNLKNLRRELSQTSLNQQNLRDPSFIPYAQLISSKKDSFLIVVNYPLVWWGNGGVETFNLNDGYSQLRGLITLLYNSAYHQEVSEVIMRNNVGQYTHALRVNKIKLIWLVVIFTALIGVIWSTAILDRFYRGSRTHDH